MEQYKQQYHFMGIALAGVYANAKSNYSSSDVSVTIYDTRLYSYLGELIEGGYVLDRRTCSDEDNIQYTFSGPMRDCTLPNDTCKKFLEEVTTCIDPNQLTSLDYVSLNLYLIYWQNKGARVGVRKGNQIHWDNGMVQEILPFESRFINW